MITPDDVKMQLMAVLPRFTDEFGDNVVASASVVGGVVQVTSVGHGLSTGAAIVGSDIQVRIPIVGQSFDDDLDQITLTTDFEHDRTSGTEAGEYNLAVLQDFDDSTYNDSFQILEATRTTIVFSATDAPTGALGNMVETRSLYLGFLTVTVIDVDTFSVPVADDVVNGTVFETFNYTAEQRILIAADITRAITAFAHFRNQEPALFVVFGVENASKDRHVVNDAVAAATAQNPLQLTYIPEVVLYYMAITKKQHSAEDKQQEVYETVRSALRRSMYGHIFEDEESAISFASHEVSNSPLFHNIGYYVHSFTYNMPYTVTIEQGNTFRRNVSLRTIIGNTTMFNNEGALVSFETNPVI